MSPTAARALAWYANAHMSYPPLTAFMPHRPPMLLLDELIEHRADEVVCTKRVRADDVLVEDGALSSLVALELFAQAAAAHFGYVGYLSGQGMASGALLGTRRVDVAVPSIAVGTLLEVRAKQVLSIPPAAQFECELRAGGELLASGSINVAIGALEER